MKQDLAALLEASIKKLKENNIVDNDFATPVQIEYARDNQHGDFASNIALMACKSAGMNPRDLAQKLIDHLPESTIIEKVEIAGPGFINFFLSPKRFLQVIPEILKQGARYGESNVGQGQRVHLEYVSANPTGPLHVGHGRGAAFGSCVANLLSAAGFEVHREYYVNDAGRQMRILTLSVWLRYLQEQGEAVTFPENAYQGQYIIDISKQLIAQYETRFHHTQASIDEALPTDLSDDADKLIDAIIGAAETLLGKADFDIILQHTLERILGDIKEDLAEFGVEFENWFRESSLFTDGLIQKGLDLLGKNGYVYEKEGAKWFKATEFGDEKDRVLIRENGQPTYFASDVAYHLHKYKAGYHQIIDIFGADHHGYMKRLRAFLKGLGEDPEKLHIMLVQFAILYRGKEKMPMSTRSGEFVTLRALRDEVGNDAARFFYVMRKPEQHLDFDLELAKSKSNENPVYYIQYAHARICSVWRQLEAQQATWDETTGLAELERLDNAHEKALLTQLSRYPELIRVAAQQHEPHLLAHYLQELANLFHTYYNAEKFLVEDQPLRHARLALITAIQHVLANGLSLLGVSSPSTM